MDCFLTSVDNHDAATDGRVSGKSWFGVAKLWDAPVNVTMPLSSNRNSSCSQPILRDNDFVNVVTPAGWDTAVGILAKASVVQAHMAVDVVRLNAKQIGMRPIESDLPEWARRVSKCFDDHGCVEGRRAFPIKVTPIFGGA